MKIWIGSPADVRLEEQADKALARQNDPIQKRVRSRHTSRQDRPLAQTDRVGFRVPDWWKLYPCPRTVD